MDKLGYQDLLSKCIQDGIPGGGYSKSSSPFQGIAEPAVRTSWLLENSTSGFKEDTSGAAEGPAAESVSGYRVVTGMDGTAMGKRRSPFIAISESPGTVHMREQALRSEGLKINGFSRSFLKSRGTVTKTPSSTFSFRGLLEGAVSASGIKRPTSVQKMAESGMGTAPKVEPQKGCIPGDSGSLSDDTVGCSGSHVSYSSLLRAQLGDDVAGVRTETPQKTARASLLDVEAHSSLLNSQLQSAEVIDGFLIPLEKTTPLLPSVAGRAGFPATDPVFICEQISDVDYSDKPSHASGGAEVRSADKVSERDGSKPLRATAVPASPVLARVEEDVSLAEVVVERGNSLVTESMCTDKDTLDFQLPVGDDIALAGGKSRSADILSDKGAIDPSEAAVVLPSQVLRTREEHESSAEVVGNRGSFVVAGSVCIDEMSDVQLLEELSRALAVDESRFAEKVLNGDAINSSEAAAVSASAVPTTRDENDARASIVVERSILGVANFVSTDERILDAQLSEEHSGTSGADESRSAENSLNRDVLESSEATAPVPESLVFTRIGEADLPAGLEPASCMVAASTCGNENISGVQLSEELSRDLACDKSQYTEVVAERNVIDSSQAAAMAVSPVPLLTEENVSLVEGVVAGLIVNREKTSDVVVSDEPSHPLALDRARSAGNILIGLSEGAGDSASPVPIITGEDVSMSEVVVENVVGSCGDAVVGTGQGKITFKSFNPSNGQVLEERIQSPSQCFVIVKDQLEGQADLVNAGTTLDLAFQSSHKEMDAKGDSVSVPEFDVCDAQIDCGVGRVSETDNSVSSDAMVTLSVEGDLLLQKVVVDERVDAFFVENLRSEELRDTGTVRECSRQAALNQIENDTVLFIEERSDEICDAPMSIPRGNVPLKSNPDFDVTEVVLEREMDICKGELVHTEEVIDKLNSSALAEKSSSTSIPLSNEHFIREESLEHSGSRLFCSEGMSEPMDAVAVLGSSWQAGTKPAEDLNSMVGKDQEDISCHTQVLEDFMGQDTRTTEEHWMGGEYGCGPQRGCVRSVEITSTTVLLHDNENLVDVGRVHADERDRLVCLTENKVGQDHMLGRPEGSSEVKRSELEQYKPLALADEAPEMQVVVSQFSESRAVNMGLVFCGTGHEAEEFPSSWLPLVDSGMRNETVKVPTSHVGENVKDATDSGNSVDLVDQVLSTDPDAISEGLGQPFLRDSDATIADSLESAQGTRAELAAGIEVQSPLVTKSIDRHSRHLDDLENSHIRHLEDLENQRTRHLDDLDENEELPYALLLNGAVHDQVVGAEQQVRPYKKKVKPRAYNHEKAIRGTGRSHFHPSGSKRNSQLQNAGNRCRRNRHIYPDQPVPVFIEGRDEGFEEADGGSFLRWLAHRDEANAAPSVLGKWVRKRGQGLVKSIIAIPSFRVVSDYEEKQQVDKRRKLGMQPISSPHPTIMSSSTVQPPSEYDMDNEDERWLHAWNKRLARGGLKQLISEDKFEEMIEYFERRSAEMIVSVAGVFPGFPHCGKSLAQPFPGGSFPRACPSGLGLMITNSTTPGTPVSGNSPTLNPPAILPGHPPWAGGLKDVLCSGRQAMVSSSFRVDGIGRNFGSPASIVRFHTLISENERTPSNSDVHALLERPSKGSLRKSFEPSGLEKLSEDCCICNGGEDDENNPVYTCKRCLIHVHQSCYGIREKFRDDEGRVIAPSNWCCRKCEAVAVGRAQPNVSCALCRKRGGALKPTVVAQKWAHVACALYTNETFFVDPDAMEPIDGIAAVAARAQERQERCGLCGVKKGICSLCAVKDCRAPFHISCGVSQGALFELRQSKQKVVGVRSFCPRHARTTAMDSASSAEFKDRHVLSSSTTSGATASATASGSNLTASSMDDREEWSSRQSFSHPEGIFGDPAVLAKNVGADVADLTDNVMSVNGKGVEDACRIQPKGIRFTLKRRWDESCDQASEDGPSSDCQKKCGNETGVSGGRVEAPGCKSTWQVVESGQNLKKMKFKFERLAHELDSESPPTPVLQEVISSEVPQAEKMPTVGDACGDVGVNERDTEFLKGLSEDRFAKEVKELMILEEAMKSGVAPGHIMREVFVYWRAKRAEFKGSLLCELHHEQWFRSQGIFNEDASDEEHIANGKMVSLHRVPQVQQPSPTSNEKTLEMAKEIRIQLERVRLMAQMVVQREKLKYNHQFVLGSIASAELSRAEGVEERHCVWCPSIKTLLKCGTCLRNFCFNCFKHRKGFGVKGWMAAMKQPMYVCKFCLELSSEIRDLPNSLDPALKKIEEGGAVSTPGNTSRPAIGVVSTSVTSSKPVGEGRGNGIGNGRVKGRSWHSPGSGLLRVAEVVVMAAVSKSVDVPEGREQGLGIGRGKGNSWTASDNARCGSPRRGSEDGKRNQSKPGQLEDGLDKFLSSAHIQMEHSSFETTLRRLKILQCTNTDPHHEVVTSSVEIPSGDIAPRPGTDGMESVMPSTTIGGNVSVPSSPGSGPALLVYKKKRRLILGESSESPPSAYDFGDQPCFPTGFENGTSV